MLGKKELIIVVIIVVVIIILIAVKGMPAKTPAPATKAEYLDAAPAAGIPSRNVAEALGKTTWTESLKDSEIDESTLDSHRSFVEDATRFSSGANFTSVTDDNTNAAFTNFQGLRRPQHVPIGDSARSIPDIDETVLQRNRAGSWRF